MAAGNVAAKRENENNSLVTWMVIATIVHKPVIHLKNYKLGVTGHANFTSGHG